MTKGEPVKAADTYRRAAALAPRDPRGPALLGRALLAQGKRSEAESAAGLRDNPAVQYHLGLPSLKAGDKVGARRALAVSARSPASSAGRDEARRPLAEIR